MENEKNELTLFSGVKNNMYCSIVADSEDAKKQLFNALETCDALLNDCVGQEIELKDIYVEERQVADEETGEMTEWQRVWLERNKNKNYMCRRSNNYFKSKAKCTLLY